MTKRNAKYKLTETIYDAAVKIYCVNGADAEKAVKEAISLYDKTVELMEPESNE